MSKRSRKVEVRCCDECGFPFTPTYNKHLHRIAPKNGHKVYRHCFCSKSCSNRTWYWRYKQKNGFKRPDTHFTVEQLTQERQPLKPAANSR